MGEASIQALLQSELQVFVLGSSTSAKGSLAERVLASLKQCLPNFKTAFTLLDPDGAGRRCRDVLEVALPGHFLHAFMPVPLATATAATRRGSSLQIKAGLSASASQQQCSEWSFQAGGMQLATLESSTLRLYQSGAAVPHLRPLTCCIYTNY